MMRFLMLILQTKRQGEQKNDFLLKAAQIPGIYVPAFYDVTYSGGRNHCFLYA